MKNLLLFLLLFLQKNNALGIPLKIKQVSNLNFGSIVAGSSTKVIPPGSSENSENASFSITGDSNAAYNIGLPVSITLLKNGTGPESLTVTSVNSNPDNTGLLSPSGNQTLFIGGSLNVPIGTARGTYSGSFTVDVVY